ncbi:MAG TPA: aliphatic sulfonate ABC transporter substrate-binding protein [Methylomusa anaerophila]|uniref:Putative aliphatic sulfonates-binding protein n=1 Tax=Methylomusa anaerophila TaxID=1930071 RepID=A0A348AEW8_9FIRM|nr:aliphatic sulfonate ABC transporter substrate-binding protein [Methylomusa anaerophila]BBB89616.1 putative aliphatic sulfonates-binding protein precursor [Methylomusa anaerophila]HML89611.1 aliphatic sulfonate ABC transporter substrate-binding protein [Methylomusa anaerophila]
MKKLKFILMLILSVILFTGCSTGKESGAKEQPNNTAGITAKELRIATQPIPAYAPIFVAKKQGWLEDKLKQAGVTVKWSSFDAGPPMNESFAAGQQDIGFLGDSAAIIPKAAGQDTRIVGLCAAAPQGLAIVVPKDSKIASAKDLKGKKVAVVKGSFAHHLLVLVLKNNGLTVDDIQFLNLSQADSATALAKGDIDAAAIWEPLITRLEDQGTAKVLVDGTGIKKGLLVIVATNNFAVKNPEIVKEFLLAYQRGSEFIKSNPQEAAKLIADEVKISPEQLVKILPKFDYSPVLHDDDIQELKLGEEFMRNAGIIKSPVDINAFIDSSYLKAAGIQ